MSKATVPHVLSSSRDPELFTRIPLRVDERINNVDIETRKTITITIVIHRTFS